MYTRQRYRPPVWSHKLPVEMSLLYAGIGGLSYLKAPSSTIQLEVFRSHGDKSFHMSDLEQTVVTNLDRLPFIYTMLIFIGKKQQQPYILLTGIYHIQSESNINHLSGSVYVFTVALGAHLLTMVVLLIMRLRKFCHHLHTLMSFQT